MVARVESAVVAAIFYVNAVAPGSAAPDGARPPLPPPRPVEAAERPPLAGEPVKERPDLPERASASREDALCRQRIEALGVRFEIRPPLRDGACFADAPLLVRGLADGVEIAPPATVNCPIAEALARWTKEVVRPEAERRFESSLARLSIATSYECRNQRSGAKLSEHAFANGVDVIGFGFEGRPALSVRPDPGGSGELAFQAVVRAGACAHFTTVLGPGSDAAHAGHLHLDLRGRKRGYRICQ